MKLRQEPEAEERARAFIDRIIEINRQHGMGAALPDQVYQKLVERSAKAYSALAPRSLDQTKRNEPKITIG